MLDLVLQLGPCRVEPVGRRLLRVRGGSDRPAVVAAIRWAGASGTVRGSSGGWRRATCVAFAAELRGRCSGAKPTSPRLPTGQAVRRPLRLR